ncbi:START domain-containing protein [Pseudomonas gingeri]|uniref:START domain-containing protein n=2 Tax=Pseudomonas gingeri TaxID=117681 RepID=A0A7Y7YBR1_9PSED|nr:START domain-containing protein [Pseudomonas gingeri]NWA01057.1 START domain-containing protein [Pseudomonas gingeri]NWA14032.1 START domain-containing protein [Pseudomonas gingeri]NWA56582.1 START domain-containing protein [Pseudomonas gingeri]NWA95076.1 START domain-containing protein [Pseudomonas gingeri]NWB05158.1 START domain-containing protein [Pseudomonas gingeri]
MKRLLSVIALTAACLSTATVVLADDWKLAHEEDGIQVFLSKVPGSHYQSFRGEVDIKADVSTLSDLQENLRVACKWLYACADMRLLKNDGDDTWVYLTTDLPWPASPRDMVLHVHTERNDDGSLVRHLDAAPDYTPVVPGLIRVRQLSGVWKMQPRSDSETRVIYQLQAEPAGDIPSWLANQFVVDAPMVSLKTLRAVAERQGIRPAPTDAATTAP